MFYQHSSILFPLLIVIGIALGLLFIFKSINKMNIEKGQYERLIVIFSYSGIAFYLGARFFDDLFHYINGEPWGKGGITFLGGMISAMVVLIVLFLIFLKPLRHRFFKIINIVAMGVILGHAFGRIGCFCAGCCYGKVTDSFIGVNFPGEAELKKTKTGEYIIEVTGSSGYKQLFGDKLDELGFDKNGVYTDFTVINPIFTEAYNYAENTKLLPTQLIETIFLLSLFGVLFLIKKYQFPLYIIGYGTFRFIIEFFRSDNRGSVAIGISPSQLLSILIVVAGIGLIFVYTILNKKKNIEI